MKRSLKWFIGLAALAGVGVLLAWAFIAGRAELKSEREQEAPVKTPPKVARTATGDSVITFDAETQKRGALVIASAEAATLRPEVQVLGKVLDPTPLVVLHSELRAAEVALTNSAAQRERTRLLFEEDQNSSRRALEASEAQFRADEIRLQTTQQRLNLDWGEGIAGLDAAERSQLIERLLARQIAFVRVDSMLGEGSPTGLQLEARLSVFGHEDKIFKAAMVSMAPTINSKVQGLGFFLKIDSNDATLRPGAGVTAFLPLTAGAESGVSIPRGAVVRFAGRMWVYLRLEADKFARREVSLDHPIEAGWFTKDGIKPGDQLVVEGGQTLLSEELKLQISVGDEMETK